MEKESAQISDGLSRKILYIARHAFFERIYDIEVTKNDTIGLKPPYLILSNHVNVWDPALINLYVNYPIKFVASDVWFNKPLLKKLLNFAGAIPKTKNVSDYFTIKKILQACKNNKVVGIFPEGKRTWDGVTSSLLFSTAKLVKHLKIPVICVLLKGACLALPRWANKSRHGKIEISYQLALTPNQISEISVKDIYKNLTNNLQHDEYQWQKEKQYKYHGLHLANKLEQFLFACPNCNSIGQNISQGNYLKCKSCGLKTKYDEYGYLTSINNNQYFNNTRDWNTWQHKLLEDRILATSCNDSIIEDCNAIYYQGKYKTDPQKKGEGCLKAYNSKLVFIDNTGYTESFNIGNIEGFNVKWNDHFEFYYNKELHRFGFINTGSAYKWVELTKKLKESSKYSTRTEKLKSLKAEELTVG